MDNLFDFIGGDAGQWKVIQMATVTGEPIEEALYLDVVKSSIDKSNSGKWTIKGFNSNIRYATHYEKAQLLDVQQDLGRPQATCAALIPIRKSAEWWAMAQDERRQIFEEQSHHTKIGLEYLPPIARKLYHCRDLGQPFDFLTWFEYAPEHATFFEDLVSKLRQTAEWQYVEREIDIRLIKA